MRGGCWRGGRNEARPCSVDGLPELRDHIGLLRGEVALVAQRLQLGEERLGGVWGGPPSGLLEERLGLLEEERDVDGVGEGGPLR